MSRLLITITAVVGLLIAAMVALLLILLDNPDAYKQRLSQTFQTQTGYGLEINGDLNWQYFPPIAIGMSDVAVTIPGLNLPLASVDSANIDLKVIPLIFGGSVEVSGISIDGLTVNASVDASGNANWEVSETTESSPADTPSADTESSGSNELQIDIGGISITNTVINYQDVAAASDYRIELTSLTTGPLGTGIVSDLAASLTLTDNITGLTVNNEMSGRFSINEGLNEFLLEALNTNIKVDQPEAPTLAASLTVNADINTDTEQAKITNTSIEVAGAKFDVNLDVQQLFGDLMFAGQLSSNTFNAKQVLIALDADPGATANPEALSQVNLSADLSGSTDKVNINNLKLGLDSSNLTGNISIALAEKTGIDFNLTVDQIVASDYLAPSSEGGSTNASSTSSASIEDSELLPIETLNDMVINGQFSISAVTYDTWNLQDLNLKVASQAAKLDVTGSAKAYQGDITFGIASQYPDANVFSRTQFSIAGVDIAQALETQAITGTIELKSAHSWRGAMMSDLTNSIDGDATFRIANGTLDVRPIKQLAAIVDGIQGTQSGIAEWPDLLPFESLNGDHKLNSGLAADQTFSANLENMQIIGKGGIDYFANQMNYDIEAVLLENVGGQFTVSKNLAGVKWPLHCEGSLDADPVSLCLPDRSAITELIKNMAAEEAKRRGKDAIQKKIDEVVPDELKDAAKGLLKGLFGN